MYYGEPVDCNYEIESHDYFIIYIQTKPKKRQYKETDSPFYGQVCFEDNENADIYTNNKVRILHYLYSLNLYCRIK